ncbi:MAG: hypothetical protein WC877_01825 [Dehalococcoidales bacterium]
MGDVEVRRLEMNGWALYNYLVLLPKRLWNLESGTKLTHNDGGRVEVAKNGDWIIGYAVNKEFSHYMILADTTYVNNEEVGFV